MLINGSHTSGTPRPRPLSPDPVKSGQEGVGFLINQAARAFQSDLLGEIRQFNLTVPGYVVLRHLLREIEATPDGVAAGDMAENLFLDPHEFAEATDRLERDGWLTKVGAGGALKPTPKAIRIGPILSASSHWMLQRALSGFSREEIDDLTAMLVRVLRNMDSPLGSDEGPLEK